MAGQKQQTQKQKTQKQKTQKKQKGGATSLPFSFFNPVSSFSSGGASADTSLTTAQTGSLARAGIFQTGGGKTRKFKMRGGFSPSVMGPFLRNVQALAAPLTMYLGWKMLQGTKGGKGTKGAKGYKGKKGKTSKKN